MPKTRNCRKIISWVKAIVSKSTIDFSTNDDFSEQVTAVDHIIHRLESGCDSDNFIVMITPSSMHRNLYKLHVIDRIKLKHLGMTSITSNELEKLKSSTTFSKYPFVFGTRYLDLESVALNSEIISSLVKALNGQCCINWRKRSQQIKERNNSVDKSTSTLLNAGDPRSKCNNKIIAEKYIKTLMKSINSNAQPPNKDIECFFSIVEYFKINIIVRPDFAYKSLNKSLKTCKKFEHPVRFFLECYMPSNDYIGSIALDVDVLKTQFLTHPKLLDNIRIIDDVFELVPLPMFVIKFIRSLCLYLCTEMILDMLGEFAYSSYLFIRNLKKRLNFFNFK